MNDTEQGRKEIFPEGSDNQAFRHFRVKSLVFRIKTVDSVPRLAR